jgi:hypothetical protein
MNLGPLQVRALTLDGHDVDLPFPAQLVLGRTSDGLAHWQIYGACCGADRPPLGRVDVVATTDGGTFRGPGIVERLGAPEVTRGELVSGLDIRGAGLLTGPDRA